MIAGTERTAPQDSGFSFRQLTDVSALSPGINHPTTAVHSLGYSAALLCECAGRDLGPEVLRDDLDRPRVSLRSASLADLLDLSMTQPLYHGASDVAVIRLFTFLQEVAWCANTTAARQQTSEQLRRLTTAVDAHDFDPAQRRELARLGQDVHAAVAGQWN